MKKQLGHIENLVLKACEELSCRLYLLEWNSGGLQVYVDKPQASISLDDCEAVLKRINLFLNEAGLFGRVQLEVSSPGVERKLKYSWHFSEAVGKKVNIITFEDIEGKKRFTGTLTQAGEKEIILESPEQMLKIPFRNVQSANLVFDFKKEKNKDLII